jgi:hypothetical protein
VDGLDVLLAWVKEASAAVSSSEASTVTARSIEAA